MLPFLVKKRQHPSQQKDHQVEIDDPQVPMPTEDPIRKITTKGSKFW